MLRVLLIDDEQDRITNTRNAVEVLLSGHEYEITSVVDRKNAPDMGVEAFKIAKDEGKPFGLVVTDFDLSEDKSGHYVMQNIGQIDAEVPIVIVSTLVDQNFKDTSFTLSKITGSHLIAVLRKNDIWSEEQTPDRIEFEATFKRVATVAQMEATTAASASKGNSISDLTLPPGAKQHHSSSTSANMRFAQPIAPNKRLLF